MIKRVKGTGDILPQEAYRWRRVEEIARQILEAYGYREIRTPIFEETSLFVRSIGGTTDIVRKEMYTFQDRKGRSITLRPEGTAPIIRAYLEHNSFRGYPRPVKLYYLGPFFRYERPQAGRRREFHQLGVEAIGSDSPLLDAETIELNGEILKAVGLDNYKIELSSVGCEKCRAIYARKLKGFLQPFLGALCIDCQERYNHNPLRILDCKMESCRGYIDQAPPLIENLCSECKRHLEEVGKFLNLLGVDYTLRPFLVRGLDYYTRTTFEITTSNLGAQKAISGGGRYDGLVEELGGEPTPAVGFSLGMERLLLSLGEGKDEEEKKPQVGVFVAVVGESPLAQGLKVTQNLRKEGIITEIDYQGRGLRAQLKSAHKLGAPYVLILGEEEMTRGIVLLRDMHTGVQEECPQGEIISRIKERLSEEKG